MDVPMDADTLALYIIAGVLSTVGFGMLYLEAKRNRLSEESKPEATNGEEKTAAKNAGKKGRGKK